MLLLKKLKLKNFKNIESMDIDFEEYNLISGNNGSGKSSILQGIRLLLTNTLPEKLSEYIRWGQKGFDLALVFEFDKVEYDYSFSYDTISKKELRFENIILKGSDASSKIEEFVNSELLLYSSISEQGQSYSMLNETPAKRLERFKQILGVERLTRIIDLAKEKVKLSKSEAELSEKEKKTLEGLKYSYFELFQLPDIKATQAELEKQEKEKAEKEKFDKIKQEWSIKKSQFDKTLNRKDELSVLIESKKKQLFSIEKVDFNLDTYNNLLTQKQNEELESQTYKNEQLKYSNYLNSLQELDSQKNDLVESKLKYKIVRLAPLSFTRDDLQTKNSKITDLEVKVKELFNHIQLAKSGKCPTCGQNFQHSVEELQNEHDSLSEELSNLKVEISSLTKEFLDYEKKVETNSQNQQRLKEIDESIQKIEVKTKDVSPVKKPLERTFNIESISKQIEVLATIKTKFENLEKVEKEILDSINKYEIELQTLSSSDPGEEPKADRDFQYDSNVYESLKKQINIYDEKVEELKRIEEHNSKIEQEEKENKLKIQELETIYYSLLGDSKEWEDARNILEKQFSSYLIEKGTQYVESKMNAFFQKCYPKYSVLFKPTDNKKSIDFYYTDNDSDTIASASLCSGFEKQLLSIAFRVALASITAIGFLILDEVDSDASSDNSVALYSNLIDSEMFNQIIAISHNEDTKSYLLDNCNAKLINLEGEKIDASE